MFFSLTMSPYQMKIHLFGADVVFLQKFYGVQQSLHLTNHIIKTTEPEQRLKSSGFGCSKAD